MMRILVAAIAIAIASPSFPQVITPQPIPEDTPGVARKGDAARGKIIAERWCAECHVVGPGQTRGKADVAPFSAVARKGIRDAELQQFLMSPHPKMPDMQIGRTEAADLVAYIDTQKP